MFGILQALGQQLAYLLGRISLTQVVGSLSVNVVEHLVGQRLRVLLSLCHDAQTLTGHHVLVAEHPRQQSSVGETPPVVVRHHFVAERVDNLLDGRRRESRQEGYVLVYLVHAAHDGHATVDGFFLVFCLEIGTQAVDVACGMALEEEEQRVVGVSEQYGVLLLIAQQRDGHAVDIVAEVAVNVLIRVCRLHCIDRRHQSGVLVYGVFVDDDILHDGGQLHIAARLEPLADASVVEIAHSQPLVVYQQRYQLVDVVGHEVAVGVDDEVLVAQEG